jgi:hypothetical protein
MPSERRFTFTISPKDLAAWAAVATEKGLSVAAWLRMLANEAVKREKRK